MALWMELSFQYIEGENRPNPDKFNWFTCPNIIIGWNGTPLNLTWNWAVIAAFTIFLLCVTHLKGIMKVHKSSEFIHCIFSALNFAFILFMMHEVLIERMIL